MATNNPNPLPRPTEGNADTGPTTTPTKRLLYCVTCADQQAYRRERAEQALLTAALDAARARIRAGAAAYAGDLDALSDAMREASDALMRLNIAALNYECVTQEV
ncbi:MAG: hypothetical protein RMN52_02325 [Anaerolineae bacterium]|nr:hypothetical protein [Candidatus Roseilinea sp.]MDW8448817.1 hypothetical protein [Anaerolineae bacterium]